MIYWLAVSTMRSRMSTSPRPAGATSTGGIVAALAILAASALLFLLIWFAVPQDYHYLALGMIGIISLVFGAASYFGRAFTRAGGALQALSWGYGGLGFALLIGSIVLAGPGIGIVWELVGLLLVVVMLGVAAGFAAWARGSAQTAQAREIQRDAWRASTPRSAFDYTTARPNVPSASPTSPDGTPPAAPPEANR